MIAWAFDAMIGCTLLMVLVLAVRGPVTRYCGAGWAYALWLLPALRLVLPQLPSLSTPVSVPSITVVLPVVDQAAAPLPVTSGPEWVSILFALWMGGAAVFAIWHQSSYSAFLLSIGSNPRKGDPEEFGGIRVIESEAVDGPVAVGIFSRRIVVPPLFNWRYSDVEQRLALEHELIHHRRGDLVWNMAALFVLALNWFNPIAHIAYRAFRADQELACDSAVARRAPGQRHDYASALVKSASPFALVAACPLNHAEFLKRRLRMMKDHRASRARTAGGLAALAILVTGGLALSSPGFAQDEEVGASEMVVAAVEKGGAVITPKEEAMIREKCGDAGGQGISLRGSDGLLVCENGKTISDPEARAIVQRVTERARVRAETALKDPAVKAAIEGEAAAKAEAAVAAIDERAIEQALESARVRMAAIDMKKVKFATLSAPMASVVVKMPHVQLSAAQEAEVEHAMAKARAHMQAAHVDKAEIDLAMREAEEAMREARLEREEALREAELDRQEALRDAHQARMDALREAQHEREAALREAKLEREQALREAELDRQAALRDAEEARRDAAQARLDAAEARREALRDAEEARRDAAQARKDAEEARRQAAQH